MNVQQLRSTSVKWETSVNYSSININSFSVKHSLQHLSCSIQWLIWMIRTWIKLVFAEWSVQNLVNRHKGISIWTLLINPRLTLNSIRMYETLLAGRMKFSLHEVWNSPCRKYESLCFNKRFVNSTIPPKY